MWGGLVSRGRLAIGLLDSSSMPLSSMDIGRAAAARELKKPAKDNNKKLRKSLILKLSRDHRERSLPLISRAEQ
jgi:hypothetical protein